MVEIDLVGEKKEVKEFPKVLLPRTLTEGIVTEVGSWTSPDNKEKILLSILVGESVVTCWMNASKRRGVTLRIILLVIIIWRLLVC